MAEGVDWRPSLTFTDRFDVIREIGNACIRKNPSLSFPAAQIVAKEYEKSLFSEAKSKEEYNATWKGELDRMNEMRQAATEEFDDFDKFVADYKPPTPAPITIGKYRDATYHHDGMFSTVYKAATPEIRDSTVEHPPTITWVALKAINTAQLLQPHNAEREVRILEDLKHDRVIPLLDAFMHKGSQLVLVFPFMPVTLEQAIDNNLLNHYNAKSHLRDLFSALAYVHGKGIIHRDVKPANILLKSSKGPAYLADFGISWSPNETASEMPNEKITDVGTTCYRAPELLFGNRAYGSKMDMWAAGCVVAEAASLSSKTLLDNGSTGTELGLIASMIQNLGTPTLKEWPEAAHFPDFSKIKFTLFPAKPWDELLPKASDEARDLVSKLVRYESKERLSAADALEHNYFKPA